MCTERYINPFTDFGFKRLFGDKSGKDYMIDFLNSLLEGQEDKIVDIKYMPTEKLGLTRDSRHAIYDIYCTSDNGSHFIVEMQNARHEHFIDRSIFYSTFPMHEMAEKGEWDYELPTIYTVAFLAFNMAEYRDSDDFCHVAKLCDTDTKQVISDKLTYIYLEVKKFDKDESQLETDFDRWMYVIKNMNRLDRYPERLQKKLFEKFFERAEVFRMEKMERLAYEASLKVMRDAYSVTTTALKEGYEKGMAQGMAQGMAEGLEQGRKHKQIEMAKAMKADGLLADKIALYTGLAIDEINKL